MDRITSFPWDFVLIGKMLGTLSHWKHSLTERNPPPLQNTMMYIVHRKIHFWYISQNGTGTICPYRDITLFIFVLTTVLHSVTNDLFLREFIFAILTSVLVGDFERNEKGKQTENDAVSIIGFFPIRLLGH